MKASVAREKVVFLSIHADSLHPSLRGAMAYIPGQRYVTGSYREERAGLPRARRGARESGGAPFGEGVADGRGAVARSGGIDHRCVRSGSDLKVHPFNPVRDNVVRDGREWVPAVIRYNLDPHAPPPRDLQPRQRQRPRADEDEEVPPAGRRGDLSGARRLLRDGTRPTETCARWLAGRPVAGGSGGGSRGGSMAQMPSEPTTRRPADPHIIPPPCPALLKAITTRRSALRRDRQPVQRRDRRRTPARRARLPDAARRARTTRSPSIAFRARSRFRRWRAMLIDAATSTRSSRSDVSFAATRRTSISSPRR